MNSVYRCFSKDGALIYIGSTEIGLERFAAHRSSTSWWEEVASLTVEHFPTRLAAYAAEREAIRAENPKYNVMSKPRARVMAALLAKDSA